MINFDITEYNFSRKDTDQYQLSILFGMDSFAYIVQDQKASVLALREYHWPEGKPTDSLWEEDSRLQDNYRQVNVNFGKGLFCLVPQRLFQEEEKATYIGHQANRNKETTIFSDNVSQHQAELVYEVDNTVVEQLKARFPGARKNNQHTVLLEAMRSHAASQASYHVAVHVNQKQLMIYAFDRTNLMLVNSYTYHSTQDFIYYVLLVYEQLGLKPAQVPLYLSGRILEDSDIYRSLQRYITSISFLPVAPVKRGPQLERHPLYFFYDLYALGNKI